MPPELDAKERRFVSEYLIDLDPKRSAIAAGYSETVAASKAYQWVSNGKVKPHVFECVQKAMELRSKRTDITADRVLQELAKIGFSDIRKVVKWHSSLITEEDNPDGGDVAIIKRIVTNQVEMIASEDVDDDTAAAIAEISQNMSGGLKIKLHDKRAALVDLGKHLGIFHDQAGAGGGNTTNVSVTSINILPVPRGSFIEAPAAEAKPIVQGLVIDQSVRGSHIPKP